MHWVKAVHTPTNTIMGVAGWMGPTHALHTIWRRSATDYYNWREKSKWTDADIKEMWSGVDMEVWEGRFEKDDQRRKEILGDEPHWYLAPLYTLPEFQGRGVASKLLNWAIVQADKTEPVTPMYLEASEMGKPIYLHVGFEQVGEENSFVRRGPKAKSEDAEKSSVARKNGDAEKSGVRVDAEEIKESTV
jgi:GNAT superfamily N-acetyltransferase